MYLIYIIRLLLQIHDELLYEVPDEDIPVISTQLKTLLESPNLVEGYCELLTVSSTLYNILYCG